MLLKNGLVLSKGELVKKDVHIVGGKIVAVADDISIYDFETYDVSKCWVIPGAIDIHAHFREPGFERKGTIKSESASAAKGGIVTAMAMPNLSPAPDCLENLQTELDIIKRDSVIDIYPYGCVTKGEMGEELADLDSMAGKVKAITDDGKGYNNVVLLKRAMEWAKKNDVIVASHAELSGYGLSEEAEYLAVMRELELAKVVGCKYHFCHISTARSFELIRLAKKSGADVSCEVTPHHLTLSESEVDGNPDFKMNPPLRSISDVDATVKALQSGIATIVATDHAPHTPEEKAVPFASAPNGIIGFETMLPVVYTEMVNLKKASHEDFLNWVVYNPAKRFGLPANRVAEGENANLAVLDIYNMRRYEKEEIVSKAENSPFIGDGLYGFNRMTIKDGNVIFKDI